jgi:Histidine kinase-, DNA gyrase B-, and HSP90-like ATPase
MDVEVELKDLTFRENLEGRIQNLAMSPSYANTLIPVFEAVMNSIQGIQDRFGDEWAAKGRIVIEALSDQDANPHSFSITDNGVGLDEDNFESFRTYDSRKKQKRGGKGVGRLTWLKVFSYAEVKSSFDNFTGTKTRSFEFVLDNEKPLKNYSLQDSSIPNQMGTTVTLRQLRDGYSSHCPKKTETLAQRIAAHFLPFLLGDSCPEILLINGSEKSDLREFISKNTYNPKTVEFVVEGAEKLSLRSVFINKALVEHTHHTIWFAANDRLVNSLEINNQTGIDTTVSFAGNSVLYLGIVSGGYLDDHVTQERNNFDVPPDIFKAIRDAATEKAKEYLKDQISTVVEAKAKTIEKVIQKFPRYAYLAKDSRELAQRLPLNRKTEEDVYREMSVFDYRETNRLVNAVAQAVQKSAQTGADDEQKQALQDGLENLMSRVGDQERSSLAEYVGKRKLVIDLLETHLGYKDESEQNHAEAAVHKIICPMRVNSNKIEYGQHNLWILDDRLAYYDFWSSDEQIKSYAKNSNSTSRPDLILFQGSTLLHRPNTSQPVVIVEFKRPARVGYDDDENPIKQVYDYIRELRSKTITDNNGKLITEIDESTPFFCYVVCDITPKLKAQLEDYSINQKLPGNRGYMGFNKDRIAYVEVLEYSKIVSDARLRHEPFFKQLGLN